MARMSKALLERRHAMQRAHERYGIVLTGQVRDDIVTAIRERRSRLVRRQSLRVAIYDVTVGDVVCRVVYDRNRHEIVTFLPRTVEAG